ncbi:hypothetical protein L596_019668 [Steinernema carpocapsae]|uniref:Uncharacterized protein n=2 Tax=Steinernema carpocapsae TaxID=34508 RepID=A0A4U5MRA4_STECR|nr:hypothetical protein L596_019668 [Steinernema carpocapsae]
MKKRSAASEEWKDLLSFLDPFLPTPKKTQKRASLDHVTVDEMLSKIKNSGTWNVEADIADETPQMSGFPPGLSSRKRRQWARQSPDVDYVPPKKETYLSPRKSGRLQARKAPSPSITESSGDLVVDSPAATIDSRDSLDFAEGEEQGSSQRTRKELKERKEWTRRPHKHRQYLEVLTTEIGRTPELHRIESDVKLCELDAETRKRWIAVMAIVNSSYPEVQSENAWREWCKLRRGWLRAIKSPSYWDPSLCPKMWKYKLTFLETYLNPPEIRVQRNYLTTEVTKVLHNIRASKSWNWKQPVRPTTQVNMIEFIDFLKGEIAKCPNLMKEDVTKMETPEGLSPEAFAEWDQVVCNTRKRSITCSNEAFVWRTWKNHEHERLARMSGSPEADVIEALENPASRPTSTSPSTASRPPSSLESRPSLSISPGPSTSGLHIGLVNVRPLPGTSQRSKRPARFQARNASACLSTEIRKYPSLAKICKARDLVKPWSVEATSDWKKVVGVVQSKFPDVSEQILLDSFMNFEINLSDMTTMEEARKEDSNGTRENWFINQRKKAAQQIHPVLRDVSLTARCGQDSIDYLVEEISRYSEFYTVDTEVITLESLSGDALFAWNRIMQSLVWKYSDATETLAWKAWKLLRHKYLQGMCSRKWRGRLEFLTEGEPVDEPPQPLLNAQIILEDPAKIPKKEIITLDDDFPVSPNCPSVRSSTDSLDSTPKSLKQEPLRSPQKVDGFKIALLDSWRKIEAAANGPTHISELKREILGIMENRYEQMQMS